MRRISRFRVTETMEGRRARGKITTKASSHSRNAIPEICDRQVDRDPSRIVCRVIQGPDGPLGKTEGFGGAKIAVAVTPAPGDTRG